MPTAILPREQHLVLYDASWDDFLWAEAVAADQTGLRVCYDRGKLEFRSTTHQHESVKMLIHDFIVALTDEFRVIRHSAGPTSLLREDLQVMLEPDQCYYLVNEPLVRGKDELDLDIDPPPDLAIEVEISRSALDRIGIYAALAVPEVWRTDGDSLRFLSLVESGEYEEQPESRFFPGVRCEDIAGFLQRRRELGDDRLEQSFREWVREVIAKSQD